MPLMPRVTLLLRTAATAAVATVVAGSLLTLAPAGASEPGGASARLVAQPAVGDCHRLAMADVREESETAPPVDCGSTHTSVTVAVVTLPEDTDWSRPDAVWSKVGTRCFRGFDAALGRTAAARARSAYGLAWFIPTPEQRSAGSSWVRCDAILWGRTALRPIPDASPLLEQPLTDRVARCLTARNYYLVVCANKHAFRATGLVRMPFKTYPGKRKAQAFAERKCPALVSSSYWRYTFASRAAWKVGNKFMVCYTQTRA